MTYKELYEKGKSLKLDHTQLEIAYGYSQDKIDVSDHSVSEHDVYERLCNITYKYYLSDPENLNVYNLIYFGKYGLNREYHDIFWDCNGWDSVSDVLADLELDASNNYDELTTSCFFEGD